MIRKIMHTILHIKASQGYVPYQDLENKHMLCGFLDQPDDFVNHIRRFTNSLTTQMVYGFRTVSNDDEKLQRLYETFDRWSQVVGSATAAFLDVYPSLRSLPSFMLPTLRFAQRAYKDTTDLYLGHWLDAKKRVLGGTSKVSLTSNRGWTWITRLIRNMQPCFCVGIVESQITAGFSEDVAGYISGTILEAGSDTTSASLIGFVQAMVLYPAAQKQAQDEVDRVCGTDRLPSIEDWDDMPYIRACIKESLRWMPTAIMGIPHAVTQDDEYRGYKIPKGAGVTLNVWAIHMDDKRHSDPRTFDPSHYIGDDQTSAESAMNGDASQRDQFVFGAGRRLCQGMHIADRSMFLAISRLLWAFNFDKAVNAHGAKITPDQDDLMEGLLTRPSSFPAKITPRSEKHAQMLRDEWDECRILLDEDEQWRDIPKGMVFKSELSEDLKS